MVAYFVFVAPVSGHVIDAEAYFGKDTSARRILVENGGIALRSVTFGAYGIALLIIIAIGAIRRSPAVGIIAAVASCCAVLLAEILKLTLPWHPLIPQDADYKPGLLQGTFRAGWVAWARRSRVSPHERTSRYMVETDAK